MKERQGHQLDGTTMSYRNRPRQRHSGTEEERFWAKTTPEPMTGCLLWTVNPRHLKRGSQLENIRQAKHENRMNHRNHARGERSANAKLKRSDIPEIRRLFAAGQRRSDIAREFRVDRGTIDRITSGHGWVDG